MEVLTPSDDALTSGFKVKVDCGDPVVVNEWLENVTSLAVLDESKKDMADKAILEAVMHKQRAVVLKIALDHDIRRELLIADRLQNAGVPGILNYYCYFTCRDDITRYIQKNLTPNMQLCSASEGKNVHILVMEYIKNKNMKTFAWKAAIHADEIRSCIKQVVATMWVAFQKTNFVHKDLNLQNILLRKTRIKSIEYPGIGSVPIHNYAIVLMDFEHSDFIEHNPELFEKDIRYFFSKVEFDMNVNIRGVQNALNVLNNFTSITHVLNVIDTFEITTKESHSPYKSYHYNPNISWGGRPKW